MIRKLTKTNEFKPMTGKIDALQAIKAGEGIPDGDSGPSVCTCFCSSYCGDCGNDAAMYTGNKEYR